MLCYLHKAPKDLERYKEEKYSHLCINKTGVKFHLNFRGYG